MLYSRYMEPSLFTRIIQGEIPAYKIYEDEKTLAFLDIHPQQPGHTLVIPKKQVEFVWDLNQEDYSALTATAKKVALRLREVMEVPYVGEMIVGTDVPHAHIHLVPFSDSHQMHQLPDLNAELDEIAQQELAKLADKLAF